MRALTTDRDGRKLNKQPSREKAPKAFFEGVDYPRLRQLLVANERFWPLVDLLDNPKKSAGKSFAALLKRSNITLAEVTHLYIQGSKDLGLLEVANQFPAVAKDIASDARSRDEACPSCNGEGYLKVAQALDALEDAALDNPECTACKGKGTIRVMGDKHARDTVSNWLGLGSRNAGVTINNLLAQSTTINATDERVEDLLAKTSQIINVSARAVEDDNG